MINPWNLMTNWNLVIPPSRPSSTQLNHLCKLSKDINKSEPVAVLGSTIEYRDLLHEMGFDNIFVFDKNRKFYLQTQKERIYKNEETLIYGNWTDTLKNYTNTFKLIVSDLTSGNIPYEQRYEFYSDIERALRIDGHFFDKILTHNNNFKNVREILRKYEQLPVNLININFFSCEILFCSEILLHKQRLETAIVYEELKTISKHPRIHKFIEKSKLITPVGFIWYYGKNWDNVKQNYCINLRKVYEKEDDFGSPYKGYVKIFNFKK